MGERGHGKGIQVEYRCDVSEEFTFETSLRKGRLRFVHTKVENTWGIINNAYIEKRHEQNKTENLTFENSCV